MISRINLQRVSPLVDFLGPTFRCYDSIISFEKHSKICVSKTNWILYFPMSVGKVQHRFRKLNVSTKNARKQIFDFLDIFLKKIITISNKIEENCDFDENSRKLRKKHILLNPKRSQKNIPENLRFHQKKDSKTRGRTSSKIHQKSTLF